MRTIDINSDLGESFGNWQMGNDEALIPEITSANVACGFHASDPLTMIRTVAFCKQHGVAVGAHPGLPDLLGFGRRAMRITPDDCYAYVLYQAGALAGRARGRGPDAPSPQAARRLLLHPARGRAAGRRVLRSGPRRHARAGASTGRRAPSSRCRARRASAESASSWRSTSISNTAPAASSCCSGRSTRPTSTRPARRSGASSATASCRRPTAASSRSRPSRSACTATGPTASSWRARCGAPSRTAAAPSGS